MTESGIVIIGGASPLLLKGRGSLQDVEQLNLLKGVCKKVYGYTKNTKFEEKLLKMLLTVLVQEFLVQYLLKFL